MKKYQVKINNMELEIIQDDDGKFITPYLCIEDWGKFGTALKPSFEPIIVARKPFKGSLVDNVIEYGVGGINIDECRVYRNKDDTSGWSKSPGKASGFAPGDDSKMDYSKPREQKLDNELGRFPANTILTYDETDFNEVCGGFPMGKRNGSVTKSYDRNSLFDSYGNSKWQIFNSYNDSGSASRYFYCAKASKRDRDEGLDVEIEEYVLKENTPKEIEQLILNSLTS